MVVVKGASEGLGLQSHALDLGLGLRVRVRTDSTAAQGICNHSGLGKVRHLAVSQLWVQERVRDGTFSQHKCFGDDNPADLMAKYLDAAKIKQLMNMMALWAEPGRAASAPKLAAEVDAFLALVCESASCPAPAGLATAGGRGPPGPSPSSRGYEPNLCRVRHERGETAKKGVVGRQAGPVSRPGHCQRFDAPSAAPQGDLDGCMWLCPQDGCGEWGHSHLSPQSHRSV